jgi:hypothetical protein
LCGNIPVKKKKKKKVPRVRGDLRSLPGHAHRAHLNAHPWVWRGAWEPAAADTCGLGPPGTARSPSRSRSRSPAGSLASLAAQPPQHRRQPLPAVGHRGDAAPGRVRLAQRGERGAAHALRPGRGRGDGRLGRSVRPGAFDPFFRAGSRQASLGPTSDC